MNTESHSRWPRTVFFSLQKNATTIWKGLEVLTNGRSRYVVHEGVLADVDVHERCPVCSKISEKVKALMWAGLSFLHSKLFFVGTRLHVQLELFWVQHSLSAKLPVRACMEYPDHIQADPVGPVLLRESRQCECACKKTPYRMQQDTTSARGEEIKSPATTGCAGEAGGASERAAFGCVSAGNHARLGMSLAGFTLVQDIRSTPFLSSARHMK